MASPQYLTVDKPGWVHCKVASDPRAKFFWSTASPWPNGERLDILEFVPFSNGSLFVRKAKKSYEADYYCVAVNSAGYKMQGISVKVGGQYKERDQKLFPLNILTVLHVVVVALQLPQSFLFISFWQLCNTFCNTFHSIVKNWPT